MRLFALALALLSMSASFRGDARAVATPSVGERWSESRRTRDELTYRLEQAGELAQSFREVEGSSTRVDFEVLAVDPRGGATHVRLVFAHASRAEADGEADSRDETLPIHGREFTVELAGGRWRVRDADGRDASAAIRDLVLREAEFEADRFETPLASLARAISSIPRGVGEPFALDEATARTALGRPDAVRSIAAKVTRRAEVERGGRRLRAFDIEFDVVGATFDARTWDRAATLVGDVLVDASSGACVALEVAGRWSVAGAAQSPESAVEVVAEGPWTVSRERIEAPRR